MCLLDLPVGRLVHGLDIHPRYPPHRQDTGLAFLVFLNLRRPTTQNCFKYSRPTQQKLAKFSESFFQPFLANVSIL